jgi:hypothetical protein
VEVDVSTLGINGTDLVLAIVSWRGQVDIAASEAGWTERHDVDQANGPSMAIYERHGDGGNASFTFELTAGLAGRVCAVVARAPNAEVEASDVATGTSTTPTAPDVEAAPSSTPCRGSRPTTTRRSGISHQAAPQAATSIRPRRPHP